MWDTNADPFSSHPILQSSTGVKFLEAVGHWFSNFQLVASPDQLGHGQHLPVRLQSNALVRAVGFLRGLHSSWGWFLWLPQGSMVMLCYQHQIHMVFLADEGLISLLAPWKAPASSMGKSLPSQSFNQSIQESGSSPGRVSGFGMGHCHWSYPPCQRMCGLVLCQTIINLHITHNVFPSLVFSTFYVFLIIPFN